MIVLAFHHISTNKSELKKFSSITTNLYKFIIYLILLRIFGFRDGNLNKCKKKSVVLTFDDGYKSIDYKLVKLIKFFNYTPYISICSDNILQPVREGQLELLSYDDIMKLKKMAVKFVNHSFSHTHLIGSIIRKEVEDNFKIYRLNGIDLESDILCLPEGIYNDSTLDYAVNNNFNKILTTFEGRNRSNTLLVERINISNQNIFYGIYKIFFKKY